MDTLALLTREIEAKGAQAVKEHLVLRGIDPDRLEVRGAGPDDPISENETAEGRQMNRRIEFPLIEEPGAQGQAAAATPCGSVER